MNKLKDNIFKKGDSVICSDYGIGYVINIHKGDYPVEVEFCSDNSVVTYTNDGRSVKDCEITLQKSSHNWKP